MTELEQLRADLATIQEAAEIAKIRGFHELAGNYDQVEGELKQKIAKLEAQEQVDPWHRAKEALYHWDVNDREPDFITKRSIFAYVQNLQAKVAELYDELHSVRIDGGKVRDDLKARIAEMDQHGRKVDQANHEHYGRLQDQIAIRDLKIEKLEGQLAGRPVSEAAEALVKEMDEFKQRETLAEQEIRIRDAKLTVDFIVRNRPNGNPTACDIAHYARHLEDQLNVATIRNLRTDEQLREKLAELTTIYNAIPPACGLARELVEKRIEGVKKEVQNNGN